ncbi:MAG: endonuclease MutS2 [Bacilli bacterium]|nr:endonuclease MutS2 [Bacilli bacterium]
MNKYLQILELNKILNNLKAEVIMEKNIINIDNITLSDSIKEIQNMLDETEEASFLILRMGRIPIQLKKDVFYILNKTTKAGILSIDEILEIRKLIQSARSCKSYIDGLKDADIKSTYILNYISNLTYSNFIYDSINNIMTPYGEINDDASHELLILKKKASSLEKSIQSKLQELISKYSAKLTDNLVYTRNDRYVIPVKNDFKNSIKGIVHDQSSSGETVFIEPYSINLINNQLQETNELIEKGVYRILKELSKNISLEYNELLANYEIILKIDYIFAKASLALKMSANKPKINKEGIFELYNAKHPLLNVSNVISNNVVIGKYQGVIITGPNTGGKTVLLKMIGLLSLMVKAGFLIPADEKSNIMIFDKVFADIGDEQSIDQNLSTFSSHLKNVIDIMNNVTNSSLVLLDELGSGTDPSEGAALAIAIFDTLIEKNCLVIATSHYSELKIHAYNSDNIINASVEFNIKTLMPTYKLLMGIPGLSNALEISKNLGLNEIVLEKAQKYVLNKNDNINQILNKLSKQSKTLDDLIKDAENKNKELKLERDKIEEDKDKISKEKEVILQKAKNDAQKLIEKTSKKIENLILELEIIKENENSKIHEIADIKHQFRNIKTDANVKIDYENNNENFKIGDKVFVANYNSYGEIIKEKGNNKYDIQMGSVSVTVNKKFLKLAKTNELERIQFNKKLSVKKNIKSELDLRGMRYEDAKISLDRYFDDVLLSGFSQFSIIHGFGTGVIRELVQSFLKSNKEVLDYRYGVDGEGGQGVTIVTLKK